MRKLSAVFLCLTLVGCGRDFVFGLGNVDTGVSDGPVFPDGSDPDGGVRDDGFTDGPIVDMDTPPDVGPRDRGFPDRDIPDRPPVDRGFPDRDIPDRGFPDRDVPDRGFPDRGFPDRDPPDVPLPDMGPPDIGPPDGGGCMSDPDCAHLDTACERGFCALTPNGGTCLVRPANDGQPCDDGQFCTEQDQCIMGQCQGLVPRTCPPSTTQCRISVCDENLDRCRAQAAPDGSACSDSNLCTVEECMGGVCVPSMNPLNGDSCNMPITIPEVVGQRTEVGDTTCFTNQSQGTCRPTTSPESVYSLNLTGHRRVVAQTSPGPAGTNFDTVLYVNNACTMPMEEACDDDGGMGVFSRVENVFPPGPHFFHVDGFGGASSGSYALAIDIDPQNTCAGVVPLLVPAPGSFIEVLGTTAGAASTFSGVQTPTHRCVGRAQSSDHVYSITINTPTRLVFETLDPTPLPRFDTTLHLRSGSCAAGAPSPASPQVACDDDGGQGTLSRMDETLQPGTYFLIADGFGTRSEGNYRLRITNAAPATTLLFPATGDSRTQQIPGGFSRQGDFVEAVHDLPALPSVSGLSLNLQITNNLTCGNLVFRVRINNQDVGAIFISPGQLSANDSFTFPAIMGTRYNIRYEVASDVQPGCGDVDLPNNVSTVSLTQ